MCQGGEFQEAGPEFKGKRHLGLHVWEPLTYRGGYSQRPGCHEQREEEVRKGKSHGHEQRDIKGGTRRKRYQGREQKEK